MKSYSSFLVRCWLLQEEADGEPKRVFNVEHIQTGRQTRTDDPGEAQRWMTEMTEAAQPSRAAASSADDALDLSPASARK